MKNSNKGKRAIILAVTYLMFGCTQLDQSVSESKADSGEVPRSLSICISEEMNSTMIEVLEIFSDKVSIISDNRLEIKIIEKNNPIQGLDDGADFAVMSTVQAAQGDANFKIFESPFYFSDYKHLTLTLNSERFLNRIAETTINLIHAKPMAAFYAGNSALLTIRDVSLDVIEQYKGLKIASGENELTNYFFEQIGAIPHKTNETERKDGFHDGKYHTIEWDTLRLNDVEVPLNRTSINICESFHAPRIIWFFVSEKIELSDIDKAVITEAMAYTLATHDRIILEKEELGFDHMAKISATLYVPDHDAFIGSVKTIMDSSARYYNLWDWVLYEEVQTIV